jgi:hypothetical protein
MNEELIVVAQAVEQVEDGIATRFLQVIAGRKEHAIWDGPGDYLAWL